MPHTYKQMILTVNTPGYNPLGSGNFKLLSQSYATSQSTTGYGGQASRATDGNTDPRWGAR